MSGISNNQKLEAHYSVNAKVERPSRPVAMAPTALPQYHLFNDTDANNRMKAINHDIYIDSKKEENRAGLKFLKFFGILVGAILLFKGLKNIGSIFKKF